VGAWAERPADLTPLPEEIPTLPEVAPTLEPEVTIVDRGETRFQEYRINGKLYKVKVIPKDGAPYYLINETGGDTWRRYDGQDTGFTVPRWVIHEF
jgi:hypothetical protein